MLDQSKPICNVWPWYAANWNKTVFSKTAIMEWRDCCHEQRERKKFQEIRRMRIITCKQRSYFFNLSLGHCLIPCWVGRQCLNKSATLFSSFRESQVINARNSSILNIQVCYGFYLCLRFCPDKKRGSRAGDFERGGGGHDSSWPDISIES
jgi:hypothetical protein